MTDNYDGQYQDITMQAIISTSTAKMGNGTHNLVDGSLDTYWQSDISAQKQSPHFQKQTIMSGISIYIDFEADESYTPQTFSVLYGINKYTLTKLTQMSLNQYSGWINIPFVNENNIPKMCTIIQIVLLQMNDLGRDCHVRQIKIYSPISEINKSNHKINNIR